MYWCVARLEREKLALHCLALNGFTDVYLPRLREHCIVAGRRVERHPPLFPGGYAFILIRLQWTTARYCPWVRDLIMNGGGPAHVPDRIIDEIKAREVGGLVELPRRRALRRGDPVRVLTGPFRGHLGLYSGMKPHQRVEVLLAWLGSSSVRVTLAADAIEAAR
jgi:transcription antitermination factor NusG